MTFWSSAKRRVYADAAAATPLSPAAKAELMRLLDTYGNAGGLHQEAVDAKNELERARATVATSIGAHSDELIFTASGTEGNNLAIIGILHPLLKKFGKVHAITCAIEHQSVLEPLRALEAEGLELTVLPVDHQGLVDPKKLAEAITEHTAFVSIQLVNSEVGTIQPVQEMAKLLRKNPKKIYFHTDACQAPLWLPLKVEKLGVDLLTLDAQKVSGPKGVGALFVKRGTKLEPMLRGGTQEFNLRAGTPNTPQAGSFAVALEDAQKNAEAHSAKISEVRDHCFNEIKKLLPDAILNGPTFGNRISNNLNVSIPGLDAQMAVIALTVEGVAASTRSACDIGDEEPSHVIQALGISKELAGTAIRLTLLPDATGGDAAFIAAALKKVADRYRES